MQPQSRDSAKSHLPPANSAGASSAGLRADRSICTRVRVRCAEFLSQDPRKVPEDEVSDGALSLAQRVAHVACRCAQRFMYNFFKTKKTDPKTGRIKVAKAAGRCVQKSDVMCGTAPVLVSCARLPDGFLLGTARLGLALMTRPG
jgi:hypothetical protein